MKSSLLLLLALSFCFHSAPAQSSHPATEKPNADSLKKAEKRADSLKEARILNAMTYPLLKSCKWCGVVPVENPAFLPDPAMKYKIVYELTYNNPDSLSKDLNAGLEEIGRSINLHVASGIPIGQIDPVIVVHGPALWSFYDQMNYQKHYNTTNPNLIFIKELQEKSGARFIACGQAMAFLEIGREQLIPDIKVAITAQTALTNYQLKGYLLKRIVVDR
jgi:intracellular sulfur oxidation DsrE/DsrF family protein